MEILKKRRVVTLIIALITTSVIIGAALAPEPVASATKKPQKVAALRVKANSRTSLRLDWKKAKRAKGYQVYMSAAKNGKYKKVKTIKKGSCLQYKKSKLKSNQKYWFRVRAYNMVKKKAYYGKFSLKKSATTKKKATPKFTGNVQVVHVNDMHTYLDETDTGMGYAKIAGFYDNAARQNKNTLFLDAGDCFFGTANGTVDQGRHMIPIINTMGIDAMVTGNHEYTYGTAHLLKLTQMLNHPALCANMVYKSTEKQPFNSYRIQTLPNGMKVGIIGLTTPVSAAMGAADVKYTDAVTAAKKIVKELKPKVDLTIALCHIGNVGEMNTTKLANEVPGIDLIIDGHSHTPLPKGDRNNDHNTLIAQTGEYCNNVGVVKVNIKENKMAGASAKLYSKDDINRMNIKPKKETSRLIQDFNLISNEFFEKIVGESSVMLNGKKADIRHHETNMGNLYADVMRAASGAQVGLFKAGPISTVDIEAGVITERTLADMTRVDSLIIKKQMRGKDIITFLNYSLSSWPKEDGSFQQVSGIRFKIDADKPAGLGDKVYDITIGGKPLEEEEVYTVATILGSDEEPGMINGSTLEESYGFSNSIMRSYIQSQPMQTIHAAVDGRITIQPRE